MEAQFGVDAAIAASKMTRQQANEVVNRLLEKYESHIEHAPVGSSYQECCDPVTGQPGEEYTRLLGDTKAELAKSGLVLED